VSECTFLRGRDPGNREVSRLFLLASRGDLSGAPGLAIPEEGSEAKLSDERGVFA
jgi:hypothetical protein